MNENFNYFFDWFVLIENILTTCVPLKPGFNYLIDIVYPAASALIAEKTKYNWLLYILNLNHILFFGIFFLLDLFNDANIGGDRLLLQPFFFFKTYFFQIRSNKVGQKERFGLKTFWSESTQSSTLYCTLSYSIDFISQVLFGLFLWTIDYMEMCLHPAVGIIPRLVRFFFHSFFFSKFSISKLLLYVKAIHNFKQ